MRRWTELGDGIWAANYESLDLNVGVVAGDGAVLVIDTRADAAEGRVLRDDLRRLSALPVGWVVNSHFHWDHTWGNEVFPGVPIWGHVRCAEELQSNGEQHRARVMQAIPERADRFAAVAITPPDSTFSESARIDLGPRTVELRYVGRGHTDSDIVAVVDGVVFAGDLIENEAPPAFGDSYPLDWPAAVAAMLDLGGDVFVPGHGPVADRTFVTGQHGDLAELARLAEERHAAGMPAAAAATAGAPFPPATARQAFERAYLQLGER